MHPCEQEAGMDDELEQRERFNRPPGEDEEVEGHKLSDDETKREQLGETSPDEDDEVEAHRF
jgi:hypothetical protein